MNLVSFWFAFSMVFIRLARAEIHSSGDVTKKRNAPERPQFPDTFQVEVEGIFKDKSRNTGADGTLYYDRQNNRAVMDMLWQNDHTRQIYSFDTNELLMIKGYDCVVNVIPDNPGQSFFPFTVDPESKQKKISSPEEALYFHKSNYVQDTLDDIEAYKYQGYIDLPIYGRNNCSIIHRFTKPDYESPSCDQDTCQPILLSISVNCAGVGEGTNDVDHLYRFFHFTNTIQDDSVFHAPPGISCDRKQTKTFPTLPVFFSFTYDIIKNETFTSNVGGLRILHKKVWYDGDLELVRVDGFDNDGLLNDIHVYDFYNEMAYVMFPQLNVTEKSTLQENMSLNKITLLPKEIFPRKLEETVKYPLYAGTRKVNGLVYHVWSLMTTEAAEDEKYTVVTELHFLPKVSEVDGGDVEDAGFQISFIEVFTYFPDEDDSLQLTEISFIPINNFQSTSHTFSEFDVSSCFESGEKKEFEISVTGQKLLVGTKFYQDFLEQLYLGIVTAASVSVSRIKKFEMVPDFTTDITKFRGGILEQPSKLDYGKMNNESDLITAFAQLEQFIKGGLLGFSISDKDGQDVSYTVNSIREITAENKDENKNCLGGENIKTYTPGEFAAVAVMMLLVGLSVGALGLVFLMKKNVFKIRVNNN